MKKYVQKLKNKSVKFYKEYNDEIDSLKNISSVIYKYSLLISVGSIGLFFAMLGIWFKAEKFLEKSKNARLKTNKSRFLKIANAYSAVLFAVAFALTLSELFTSLLL